MGITFSHAGFSFNGQKALENVCLTLGEGITAVMGPNGAGKTTLLQLAAGVLTSNPGEMLLDGDPYSASDPQVKKSLGFLPQAVDFPEHLTPRKLITYLAQLRFLDPCLGIQELERLGISSLADRRFETLSPGESQLVGIAQALMGSPQFLILDEPFHGLDVIERDLTLRAIQASGQSRIVAFSTHVPNEIELLANHVIILAQGRAIYSGGAEALRREATGHVYEMDFSFQDEKVPLSGMHISRRNEKNGKTILRVIGQAPCTNKLTPVEPTLEDAYLWIMCRVSDPVDDSNVNNRHADAA